MICCKSKQLLLWCECHGRRTELKDAFRRLHAVNIRSAKRTRRLPPVGERIGTWGLWVISQMSPHGPTSPGRYSVASWPVAKTWCIHFCHDDLLSPWPPSNDVTGPRWRANGPVDAGLWLDYHQRTSAASRWTSTRLNLPNTAADAPDTRQREIVGGKRRSMNRSGFRRRQNLCRQLPAARRRQKYEPLAIEADLDSRMARTEMRLIRWMWRVSRFIFNIAPHCTRAEVIIISKSGYVARDADKTH